MNDWSSFEEDKLLTESWRRYLNEELLCEETDQIIITENLEETKEAFITFWQNLANDPEWRAAKVTDAQEMVKKIKDRFGEFFVGLSDTSIVSLKLVAFKRLERKKENITIVSLSKEVDGILRILFNTAYKAIQAAGFIAGPLKAVVGWIGGKVAGKTKLGRLIEDAMEVAFDEGVNRIVRRMIELEQSAPKQLTTDEPSGAWEEEWADIPTRILPGPVVQESKLSATESKIERFKLLAGVS